MRTPKPHPFVGTDGNCLAIKASGSGNHVVVCNRPPEHPCHRHEAGKR